MRGKRIGREARIGFKTGHLRRGPPVRFCSKVEASTLTPGTGGATSPPSPPVHHKHQTRKRTSSPVASPVRFESLPVESGIHLGCGCPWCRAGTGEVSKVWHKRYLPRKQVLSTR